MIFPREKGNEEQSSLTKVRLGFAVIRPMLFLDPAPT